MTIKVGIHRGKHHLQLPGMLRKTQDLTKTIIHLVGAKEQSMSNTAMKAKIITKTVHPLNKISLRKVMRANHTAMIEKLEVFIGIVIITRSRGTEYKDTIMHRQMQQIHTSSQLAQVVI